MSFQIGEAVRYIPGYRGYHAATVVGIEGATGEYIIEFTSGKRVTAWEDELETDDLNNFGGYR